MDACLKQTVYKRCLRNQEKIIILNRIHVAKETEHCQDLKYRFHWLVFVFGDEKGFLFYHFHRVFQSHLTFNLSFTSYPRKHWTIFWTWSSKWKSQSSLRWNWEKKIYKKTLNLCILTRFNFCHQDICYWQWWRQNSQGITDFTRKYIPASPAYKPYLLLLISTHVVYGEISGRNHLPTWPKLQNDKTKWLYCLNH